MKEYLGDSVYAEYDGSEIILTTGDAAKETDVKYRTSLKKWQKNRIYLDPLVVERFLNYVKSLKSLRETK
jgi:hypothetical protein